MRGFFVRGEERRRTLAAANLTSPMSTYVRVRNLIKRALGSFSRFDDLHSFYEPKDRVILDYGWAGDGDRARWLIERGATKVYGFDRWWKDEADVERVREIMRQAGVADRVEFTRADPYALSYADDSFDVVVGQAILTHLDLDRALPEIRRVLKPGGRGVFVETLGHNPILRAGRIVTKRVDVDPAEPFTESDWEKCAQYFPVFEHTERELTSIPLMPLNLLLPARAQGKLARFAWWLDEKLMKRFPGLRKYARLTFLILK
jgi:ubiquinone/menaquinone biosynthesis C-methylase UbiE